MQAIKTADLAVQTDSSAVVDKGVQLQAKQEKMDSLTNQLYQQPKELERLKLKGEAKEEYDFVLCRPVLSLHSFDLYEIILFILLVIITVSFEL